MKEEDIAKMLIQIIEDKSLSLFAKTKNSNLRYYHFKVIDNDNGIWEYHHLKPQKGVTNFLMRTAPGSSSGNSYGYFFGVRTFSQILMFISSEMQQKRIIDLEIINK